MLVTTAPYLPVTGALPLRFAATRHWPAPMSKTDAAPDQPATPTATAGVSPRVSTPADVSSPTPPALAASAPSATSTVAGAPGAATVKPSSDSIPLSAEMILGYLGNLPASEGRVGARFEPAIPRSVTTTAAASLTP